ncbi:contractile injection system tape measure protein [Mucilaginibacter endophyticus]|uniref:contractile injection system tape measure protein n=1 Tax=Mucilaginibacter endophyticus TaxID=2675003 RepID=UPI000E0D6DA9|nr:contractile injection system tape measure protein [Mucilaginibacter endophyticus]
MVRSTHIIHKLILDIEVPHRNAAQKAQDEAVRYFEQVLLKKLEQLLDSMDVPAHVMVDRLDLDLGKGELEEVFERLQQNMSKALEYVLNPSLIPDGDEPDDAISYSSLTDEQQAFNVFVYFLNTGRLPWYIVATAEWLQQEDVWLSKLSGLLMSDATYRLKLINLFKCSQPAISRLFSQFDIAFIKQLAAVLLRVDAPKFQTGIDSLINEIKDSVSHQSSNGNEQLLSSTDSEYRAIIEKLLHMLHLRTEYDVLPDGILKKLIDLITGELKAFSSVSAVSLVQIADKAIQTAESKPALQITKPTATPDNSETNLTKDEETEGAYINQAGLVILHPFLEYFFKDFGLLHDNDFVDLPARQLAVHLLHYLGTGNTGAFEYDLYFEKFLCRWPANEILAREVEIPQRMLEEGDTMLGTVIKYWKALKNTSPGGLRDTFLIRNGKLIEAEKPARLIVERKDLDILLSSLPWGIGVIKLPWMDEPFYVEWQ